MKHYNHFFTHNKQEYLQIHVVVQSTNGAKYLCASERDKRLFYQQGKDVNLLYDGILPKSFCRSNHCGYLMKWSEFEHNDVLLYIHEVSAKFDKDYTHMITGAYSAYGVQTAVDNFINVMINEPRNNYFGPFEYNESQLLIKAYHNAKFCKERTSKKDYID